MRDTPRRSPRATLDISSERAGDEIVIRLAGEFDLSGTDAFQSAIPEIPLGARVGIDLAELEFIDSSGLRALMNLDLRARTDGWKLELRSPQGQVRRLLEICGFDKRFDLTDPR